MTKFGPLSVKLKDDCYPVGQLSLDSGEIKAERTRTEQMAKERILVVDDDADIRRLIKKALQAENMTVDLACGGNEALEIIKSSDDFDLIILDVVMNDLDGFELVKLLRNSGVEIPIFLLSGRTEDYHKILGLGLGADDYITKPFSPAVLCAKIKAHIRRSKVKFAGKSDIIKAGPFKFDCNTYKVYNNGVEILLSPKETMLMKFFITNPNQVFTKEQLYQNVWGDIIIDDKTITVYIWHLRNKLEVDPKNPQYLKTVWGIGYNFSTDKCLDS